jgi:hypothetical protein
MMVDTRRKVRSRRICVGVPSGKRITVSGEAAAVRMGVALPPVVKADGCGAKTVRVMYMVSESGFVKMY